MTIAKTQQDRLLYIRRVPIEKVKKRYFDSIIIDNNDYAVTDVNWTSWSDI